jgi:ribosomal-protein-alanine N-acetyltransferase
VKIDQECFGSESWTEDEFIVCLRTGNCIAMVIEHDDRIVGFMVYELHSDHIALLNFAVDPWCARRGFGRQMMEKLQRKLSALRRNRIIATVRESNLDAHLFFKAMGFRATAIIDQHWDNLDEDAYMFEYEYEFPLLREPKTNARCEGR